MGNNASSPKASGSAGHAGAAGGGGRGGAGGAGSTTYPAAADYHQQLQQQQQQQLYARNPALVQNQRSAGVAAPPEQSMAFAQGSSSSAARRISISAAATAATGSSSASPNATSKPRPMEVRGGAPSSLAQPPPQASTSTVPRPTLPVDVPTSHAGSHTGSASVDMAAAAAAAAAAATAAMHLPPDSEPPLSPYADSTDVSILHHNSIQDMSYLTRPPRLPLPIEEEVHTPGSPILGARITDSPTMPENIEALDYDESGLTHRSSTVSSATVDDEDDEELRVDKTRPTVPTRLEWLRGGKHVYVTGTIFQWSRKQRLHPVEGRPGVFATVVNTLPGTHHIRFLVDGQMQTSRDLPTTVDFGNNLVNYIEVTPQSSPPTDGSNPAMTKQQPEEAKRDAAHQTANPTAPQQNPSPQKNENHPAGQLGEADASQSSAELTNKLPRWKPVPAPSAFSHKLPQYLVDYDQPDDSPEFLAANAATEVLPTPPSLPGFLGKPILNAAAPIKDDNSVLILPNHTVLNHLATSSIKNNILAVSATTRYKDKFVTNIIYKPTGGDDRN